MAKGKEFDKNFFKQWSSDMAYILGFLYADGNLVITKRGNCYVAFYTKDKGLLLSMKKIMSSKHKVSKRSVLSGHVYRMQIGSKEWFNDLGKIGLVPNKVARMEMPMVPKEYAGDFVRGYFDGDGNVWKGYVHKERSTPLMTLQVAFTSGSHEYLKSLRIFLWQLGLNGGGLYKSRLKRFSRLSFSARDSFKLYEIMYNGSHKLYLKRKKAVFDQFIKMRE